jgi:hypothetical protein
LALENLTRLALVPEVLESIRAHQVGEYGITADVKHYAQLKAGQLCACSTVVQGHAVAQASSKKFLLYVLAVQFQHISGSCHGNVYDKRSAHTAAFSYAMCLRVVVPLLTWGCASPLSLPTRAVLLAAVHHPVQPAGP